MTIQFISGLRSFLCCSCIFSSLYSEELTSGAQRCLTEAAESAQDQVKEIDHQMEQLHKEVKKYRARQKYEDSEADRMQFRDWVTYRRCVAMSERYKNLADQAEQKILSLQEDKKRLQHKL